MTKLLAQHGAAKGQKIENAIDNGYLYGALFSPREESFLSIQNYSINNTLLTFENTFLDPQLYYSTFEGEIFKHLEDDICYPSKITRKDWRRKSPELMNYIDKHAENSASISNALITPGFFIQSLDWHFDYSLDIYEHCQQTYNFEKYYLSLLISNSFFHSKSDVDEMLEDIRENIENKNGIYFTLCHEPSDEKDYEFIDPQNLANILYFVYSLKSYGFDVMVGYTFLNSILFAMLDCEYVASGWFNNIRKFSKDRFEEINNMGRRKKKYTSLPLLTYITFENLNHIDEETGILEELLSQCNIDEDMVYDQDSISYVDLEQQYWEALSLFIEELNTCDTVNQKVNYVLSEISNAKMLYNRILASLVHEPVIYKHVKVHAKHLDAWFLAIETFKKRISLL